MTRVLEAWLEGRYIGQFRSDELTTVFVYDETAPDGPISLSLPRDGSATKRAAANFLENLLPDHQSVRDRMRSSYGAASTGTFDLLEIAGGDVAGGLVLAPEGVDPVRSDRYLDPATEQDIASRIASIKRDADAWVAAGSRARFSLGGTQGKFAIAEIDRDWYWSNSTVASTHIVKPGRPQLAGMEEAEVAAMRLAADTGLTKAPRASVMKVMDQTAYAVERFDRIKGAPFANRLHAEDLMQASGSHPDNKYGITAKQAIELLRRHAPSQVMAFVDQLAFNVAIGNADAHGKNYSVLLRPDGVELSPLYDSVPTGIFPQFDQGLAMQIGGASRSAAVSTAHWRKLARAAGLDQDEVSARAARIYEAVLERNDTAWDLLPPGMANAQRGLVERAARQVVGAPVRRSHRAAHELHDEQHRGKTSAASNTGSFKPRTGSRPSGSL